VIKNYRIQAIFNSVTSLPNLMQIYQTVQKVSTDPSNLKPAIPLGFLRYSKQVALMSKATSLPLCRFSPAVDYMPWLPSAKDCM
jgi:hypothetical protein